MASDDEVCSSATWWMRAAFATVTWFFFNISMGSVTKWTYLYGQVCEGGMATGHCRTFQFPFMVTAVHMLFSWIVCLIIITRRTKEGGNSASCGQLSLTAQMQKIVPLAFVFSVCVACGNMSLKYIYPSFNQMLASISPLVTVLMSVLLRGKKYNFWAWASMPIICSGLLVCNNKEVNYNSLGVALVIAATVLRAMKSVMQEKLLDPRERDLDAVSMLYYLAPWAGGFLLAMSLVFEGLDPLMMLLPGSESAGKTGVGRLLSLLVLSGLNACFLNISGNLVTAYMGAVMLQILGNVKACLAIVVSAAIFKNPVMPQQGLGVVLCLFGVWLYNSKGGVQGAPAVATKAQ